MVLWDLSVPSSQVKLNLVHARNRESPTVPSVHARRRIFPGPSVGAFLPLYLSGDPIKGTGMAQAQFTAFRALTWSPAQGKDFCPVCQLRANRVGKIRHPQSLPVLPVSPLWRNWFVNTQAPGAQWKVVWTSGMA